MSACVNGDTDGDSTPASQKWHTCLHVYTLALLNSCYEQNKEKVILPAQRLIPSSLGVAGFFTALHFCNLHVPVSHYTCYRNRQKSDNEAPS